MTQTKTVIASKIVNKQLILMIMNPELKIVEGYSMSHIKANSSQNIPSFPSYQTQAKRTESLSLGLIVYLRF